MITPSLEHAQAYLNALGALDAPQDFRAIHETDRARPAIPRRGTLADLWPELCDWNAKGYGIYVTPATLDGQGRELANVQTLRAHYIDLDSASAAISLANAQAWHPAPHMVVNTSPGKHHVYWLIEPHADTERFTIVQRKLVTKFASDPAVIDATRIMRLPGTLHRKGAPWLVTCQAATGWGTPRTSTDMLEIALHGIEPAQGMFSGGRLAIGEGERAPDYPTALQALQAIDVAQLTDRNDWLAVTGAFMQSVPPEQMNQAHADWLAWGAAYPGRDEAADQREWLDLLKRGTTVRGWGRLHRTAYDAAPGALPEQLFGQVVSSAPTQHPQVMSSAPDQHAAIQPAEDSDFTTYLGPAGSMEKLVSTEIFKFIRAAGIPIGRNTFTHETVKTGPVPWPSDGKEWSDDDYEGLRALLQREKVRDATDRDMIGGVRLAAMTSQFNPVVDWLESLTWDGVARLDDMFATYFKADPNEAEWARIISPKFMIGMINRAMRPGCKRDEMIILQGAQGIMKSTALNILAGDEYFSDNLPDIHDKDVSQHLEGLWMVEIGEMAKILRGNQEDVKAFLVRKEEKYRPPYGKTPVRRKRTVVFAGTTNADQYLNDPTGERRYWPVKCMGAIDLDGLRRDRAQLFAEAMQRWRSGEPAFLTTDAERAAHDAVTSERSEHDPWQHRIEAFCGNMNGMPILMESLFEQALNIPYERRDPKVTGRVARILRKMGYERKQLSSNGKRHWAYVKTT